MRIHIHLQRFFHHLFDFFVHFFNHRAKAIPIKSVLSTLFLDLVGTR
ncbi:Uncharacterised protein [Vibrio cholerae]|nr:Uncharacterised protein [Vibrio cholerae]